MESTRLWDIRIFPIFALAIGLGSVVACSSHHGSSSPDADAGPPRDAATRADADAATERTAPDATCADGAGARKLAGEACGCTTDCASGFCVEGVCCNSACTESCKSCKLTGTVGMCTSIGVGSAPRDAKACPAADPSTCGLDGACDGAGGCRRYPAGSQCQPGTCDGDAVVGAYACDGAGRCKPGPTVICVPFSCNSATGSCFDTCTISSQCVSGQQCVSSSCGKKMKGARCSQNPDCASGFCADGVCCNVACQGGCVSCALPGREGTCWAIDSGAADPRGVCKDQGSASCGTTGACDGFGGCAQYAAETQCIAPSCSGNRLNTAGTCDGVGTCRPSGVQNCTPFRCVDGACNTRCVTDADCDVGRACVNNTCGPKQNGQTCAAAGECLSGQCVDGVCCDTACTGACRSCALPSTPGKCTSIPAGNSDPRAVCKDAGAASCGANGKCDGSGGCQKYSPGTLCAAETCASNVYTPASTCSATGQCVAPDALPCSPYVCNGSKCFNACTSNANCLTPNVCNGNSCGKKTAGASCSGAVECQSGFCAQGICCDTACTAACKSCALPGMLGACTNVPTGSSDPSATCTNQGPAGCGNNGKCEAGACQKYAKGTACKDSTCPPATTQFTPGSTCDGAGKCVTPASSSCFPFQCGTGVCKSSCTADADCASPAVCISGSCGLKGLGKTCADGKECLSGFCAQGVCCNTACTGACLSCALSASLGTCSNVANGATDPQGTCKDQGTASCAGDGFCNGAGACRLYAAGTQCVAPSCPAGSSTLTQARTCDGGGTCKVATTIACAPYMCNGTSACKAACTVDTDCLAPNICDPKTNLCGSKKRLGQACTATADCLTGNFCVDGVCCGAASCGLCQACNVAGSAGGCANVGSGAADPHARCPAAPPCGNTGNCNGSGACQQGSTSVSCGTASCTGSTFTPVSHCNGTGGCATATTSSCSPYVCGTGVCKTTCTADADCIAPFTCQGSGATRSCALKPNGAACTAAGQCISGACVDGACCGSASCPFCQACNVNGLGSCAPVAAGTAAPAASCPNLGATSCSTNGKCDGAGGCQKFPDGTVCAAASCPAGSATLTTAGSCAAGACSRPTQLCTPYFCNGAAACNVTCSADTDCAAGYFCTGAGGTCTLKSVNGAACTRAGQCGSNHCVDGACCGEASCPSCQACNISGDGTCAPVAAGTVAPAAFCADQGAPSCGTNGRCNGAGGCQKYADGTTCSAVSCPAGSATLNLAGKCSGGGCNVPTQPCVPYFCNGAAACRTTCNADGDCAGGYFCTGAGGSCVLKQGNGSTCTAAHQCATGNCVDGLCCDGACAGPCVSCALTGSAGSCTAVAGGAPDPRGLCTDKGASACTTNGRCDGGGGCQLYDSSTICSQPRCPSGGSTLTLAGTCTAPATCTAGTQSCNGFVCNATAAACLLACAGDADCVAGDYCQSPGSNGACLPRKGNGNSCAVDDECTNAHCVEGICCGVTICPSCQSCAVPGQAGACAPVPAGAFDPRAVCTDSGSIGCGTDGRCDGSGACELYGPSTPCAAASCPAGDSTLTSARFCDGAGACAPGTLSSCGACMCDGAQSCLACGL